MSEIATDWDDGYVPAAREKVGAGGTSLKVYVAYVVLLGR
jgi:hypothetical protein